MKKTVKLILSLSCLTLAGSLGATGAFLTKVEESTTSADATYVNVLKSTGAEAVVAENVLATDIADIDGNNFYDIDSAEKLVEVANQISLSGNNKWISQQFELTADIDLSGKLWTPIGTSAHPFQGSFTGNSHTVSGITELNSSVVGNHFGLFGYVSGAQIADIVISNAFIFTDNTSAVCGNLVGYATGSIISNIYDLSTASYSTIGQVAGTSYVYRGGAHLGGKTVANSTTIGAGTPTGTGYVVNFDKNDNTLGANTRIVKDSKILNDTYKVVTTNGTSLATTNIPSSIPTYGTALPKPEGNGPEATRDDEFLFNGWRIGDTSTAFTGLNNTVSANNYVVKANWKEITYSFNVYKVESGSPTFIKTISNVKLHSQTWENLISNISGSNSGYDLISAYTDIDGNGINEQRYGAVTVKYDASGNRKINDTSTIDNYLPTAITNGASTKINLGDRSTINIYTTWQGQNLNLTVNRNTNYNGALASDMAITYKYVDDESAITLDADNKTTLKAGAPFKAEFTVPYGYTASLKLGDGAEQEYGAGNRTAVFSSGITSATTLKISLARVAKTIIVEELNDSNTLSYIADNGLAIRNTSTRQQSTNVPYTTVNNNNRIITTYVDDSFTLEVAMKTGFEITSATISGVSAGSAMLNGDGSISISGLTEFNNATLHISTSAKTFSASVNYVVSNDYETTQEKPAVSLSTNGGSQGIVGDSTIFNLGNGTGELTLSDNPYYSVTGVVFNSETCTAQNGVYSYNSAVEGTSNTITVSLQKRNYLASVGLKGEYVNNVLADSVKNIYGQSITPDENIAVVGVKVGSQKTPSAANDSTSYIYGDDIYFTISVVSDYYEFDGWYLVNGDNVTLLSTSESACIDAATTGGKEIYATLKPKTIRVSIINQPAVLEYNTGITDQLGAGYTIRDTETILTAGGYFDYTYGQSFAFNYVKNSAKTNFGSILGWYSTGDVVGTITVDGNSIASSDQIASLLSTNLSSAFSLGSINIYPVVEQNKSDVNLYIGGTYNSGIISAPKYIKLKNNQKAQVKSVSGNNVVLRLFVNSVEYNASISRSGVAVDEWITLSSETIFAASSVTPTLSITATYYWGTTVVDTGFSVAETYTGLVFDNWAYTLNDENITFSTFTNNQVIPASNMENTIGIYPIYVLNEYIVKYYETSAKTTQIGANQSVTYAQPYIIKNNPSNAQNNILIWTENVDYQIKGYIYISALNEESALKYYEGENAYGAEVGGIDYIDQDYNFGDVTISIAGETFDVYYKLVESQNVELLITYANGKYNVENRDYKLNSITENVIKVKYFSGEYTSYTIAGNTDVYVDTALFTDVEIQLNGGTYNSSNDAIELEINYNEDIISKLTTYKTSIIRTGYEIAGWVLVNTTQNASYYYGFGFGTDNISSYNGNNFSKYINGNSVNFNSTNFTDGVKELPFGGSDVIKILPVWSFTANQPQIVTYLASDYVSANKDGVDIEDVTVVDSELTSVTLRIINFASDLNYINIFTEGNNNLQNVNYTVTLQKKNGNIWNNVGTYEALVSGNKLGCQILANSTNDSGIYRIVLTVVDNVGVFKDNIDHTFTTGEFEIVINKTILDITSNDGSNDRFATRDIDSLLWKDEVVTEAIHYIDVMAPYFKANASLDGDNLFAGYNTAYNTIQKVNYIIGTFRAESVVDISELNDTQLKIIEYLGFKSILALTIVNYQVKSDFESLISVTLPTSLNSCLTYALYSANYALQRDVVKILLSSNAKIQNEILNTVWRATIPGVRFEKIVAAEGVNGSVFTNSHELEKTGVYNTYYKLSFNEDDFKSYKNFSSEELTSFLNGQSLQDYILSNVDQTKLIHITSGDNRGYYLVNTETLSARLKSSIVDLAIVDGSTFMVEIEDNYDFASVDSVRFTQTITGVTGAISVEITAKTSSGAIGTYSMQDGNLIIEKFKVNVDASHNYVVKNNNGTFVVDTTEGTFNGYTLQELAGIDANKYMFVVTNSVTLVSVYNQESINVKGINVDNLRVTSENTLYTGILITITRVYEENDNVGTVVSGGTGIYSNGVFLGRILGNGTYAPILKFTNAVKYYDYAIEGSIQNYNYIGLFEMSTTDAEYESVLRSLSENASPVKTLAI